FEASEAVKTTKAPEGAFVLSAIRQVPDSSEFVAEADHVDHRVDVYIDFGFGYAECAWAFDGGLGINIDIANLSVDHQAVGQHIVSTDLKGQTPRVIQLQAAEALSFALAAQVFLEECGVVNADTDIRLESRFAVQRVVNHA